jgi:undecaprenol kinase
MISPRSFFRSLRHACRGLCDLFRTEQSFRIQTLVSLGVLFLVVTLPLQMWERILLLLLTSAVVILEIINSIIERVADAVQPRLSPMVREVKDMMAGAVLLSALVSAVIGFIILYPPLMDIACAILHFCKP